MKEIIEFLKIRRKNLQITMCQVDFCNKIKDKNMARNVLRGRLNEINRLIRKFKTQNINEIIEKEDNSYRINKEKKNREVKESLGLT